MPSSCISCSVRSLIPHQIVVWICWRVTVTCWTMAWIPWEVFVTFLLSHVSCSLSVCDFPTETLGVSRPVVFSWRPWNLKVLWVLIYYQGLYTNCLCFFYLLICFTRDWTHSFTLARQASLPPEPLHQPFFVLSIFEIGFHKPFAWGWIPTMNFLIFAS
jgi:hypothetical protein